MKKILLAFFLCSTQVSFVLSQTIKDGGSISLLVGPAFPTGKFSSTDLYDKSSGFAKIGESALISYSNLLSKEWGISVDILGQRNPLNTSAFENTFSQLKLYQGFSLGPDRNNPPPVAYSVYSNWKFEKKAWLFGALLLGGNGQFAVGNSTKFQLLAKTSLGMVYVKLPGLNGSSITDTATAHIEQSKSSGFGFIYSISGGLNYYLNKSVFLSSALKYVGTNEITFKDVKTTLTTIKASGSLGYSIQQSVTTSDGRQMMSSINLSVGVGIKL